MNKSQKPKRPTLKSLRQGQTVYEVMALGNSSLIMRYIITKRPYKTKWGSWFIETPGYGSLSLMDRNVIPNTYNDHKMFYSEKLAQDYKQKCIDENINYAPNYSASMPWPVFQPPLTGGINQIGLTI